MDANDIPGAKGTAVHPGSSRIQGVAPAAAAALSAIETRALRRIRSMSETTDWLGGMLLVTAIILTALQLDAALSSEHDKLRDEIATLRAEAAVGVEPEAVSSTVSSRCLQIQDGMALTRRGRRTRQERGRPMGLGGAPLAACRN